MIWIDGRESAAIAVLDRGLQYGDGCFTTLRVCAGRALFLAAHLDRLARDSARLGIPCPPSELLRDEVQGLMAQAGLKDGVLKLLLTRGQGGRGYRWPEPMQTTRVLSLHPGPSYPDANYQHGVRARTCTLRLGRNPQLAGIKHLNRLEQVLARHEWNDADIAEGVLLDSAGYLVEGCVSNVFWIKRQRLYTPRLDQCGVAGVMRGLILRWAAALDIPVTEVRARPAALFEADETFVSNSVIGLWPLRQLDQHRWLAPGLLTQQLSAHWRNAEQHAELSA